MKILVTGAAGFIGFHTCKHILERFGADVVGIDNLNDYYPVSLKRSRLEILAAQNRFKFVKLDFADREPLQRVFEEFRPNFVIHLGAQAGVRYSLQNPQAYIHSNITGFHNVVEACRKYRPRHLLFASSSSVYGTDSRLPFTEDQAADKPESFYAVTKRTNELMAHSFARLYGLNITAVRFFTAYGPWGRPDMAPTLFSNAICAGDPVQLYNYGNNSRDFTYIDDVVEGILQLLLHFQDSDTVHSCRVFNLGNNHSVNTRVFVETLADLLGKKLHIELLPPQPGDVIDTRADLTKIHDAVGYVPRISIDQGLERFIDWYTAYYQRIKFGSNSRSLLQTRRAA